MPVSQRGAGNTTSHVSTPLLEPCHVFLLIVAFRTNIVVCRSFDPYSSPQRTMFKYRRGEQTQGTIWHRRRRSCVVPRSPWPRRIGGHVTHGSCIALDICIYIYIYMIYIYIERERERNISIHTYYNYTFNDWHVGRRPAVLNDTRFFRGGVQISQSSFGVGALSRTLCIKPSHMNSYQTTGTGAFRNMFLIVSLQINIYRYNFLGGLETVHVSQPVGEPGRYKKR